MDATSAREGRQSWFPAVGAGLVVVVLAGLLWWGWNRPEVLAWKEAASPFTFFAVMALLPAVGVPITPFFVLAGATFGSRIGLVGSAVALAANLTLCHWVARGSLRPWMTRLLGRFGYTLPNFDARKTGAVRFTLLVKLTPGLPAFAKNYLLGIASVPLATYLVISMMVTGVYGSLLVVLGESVFHHELDRSLVAVLLATLAVVAAWVWRRRRGSSAAMGTA